MLKDAGITDTRIESPGYRIAERFYIPLLRESKFYDRATGYFSVDALVHAASGVAGLVGNNGRMRLVLGAHDVPEELWQAYKMGFLTGRDIVEALGRRISEGLERIEDAAKKNTLEWLAWMLSKGILEVKVAVPRHSYLGHSGIFHYKTMIFKDAGGNVIAAEGSANETEPAYTINGESINVFYSWREYDRGRVEEIVGWFERLWNREHQNYDVFNLPEAVQRALVKFRPPQGPVPMPEKPRTSGLLPATRFVRLLPQISSVAHLGLGPVRLYPHQARAVNLALDRYPFRVLFADEVGLGKTIEAGACIKLLWSMGHVRHVLVLAPKNVTRQWWEELRKKFGLPAYLFEPPDSMIAPDGKEFTVGGNPFDAAEIVVASWHYVRGRRGSEPDVLTSRHFDLVLIDEAHAARITRSEFSTPRPTRLYELARALSALSPHIFLLTATPLQLNEFEMLDLLKILGLGGSWVHEDEFKRFYDAVGSSPGERSDDEWLFMFRMVSWFANQYLEKGHVEALIGSYFKGGEAERLAWLFKEQDINSFRNFLRSLDQKGKDSLDRLMRALMPTSWFIIRNTRDRLKESGYSFPQREVENIDVQLDGQHKELLKELDQYLSDYYDEYKRLLKHSEKRGTGLIKSVYYQRFISSFASAYRTVERRICALEKLMEGDTEQITKLASELLPEVYDESDDEVIELTKDQVKAVLPQIQRELEKLRELKGRLFPYSSAATASGDPKLQTVRQAVERLRSEGRKVLVFSKFTDTVEIVRDFLSRSFGKARIGTYTGKGGEIWSAEEGAWAIVDKEEVKKALGKGVDVLVCSDAASEGLNLQEASAIVNVDMPWNPARVEQRIGRVDRIGQRARDVKVVNIWYPDSYEAKIYRALFERQNIWWIIVGPAGRIISEKLTELFSESKAGRELEQEITGIIGEIERNKDAALRKTRILPEDVRFEPDAAEVEMVRLLERFIRLGCSALGLEVKRSGDSIFIANAEKLPERIRETVNDGLSLNVGDPNALVPGHPFVQWLASEVELFSEMPGRAPASVFGVGNRRGLMDLYLIEEGKPHQHMAKPEDVVRTFRLILDLCSGGVS